MNEVLLEILCVDLSFMAFLDVKVRIGGLVSGGWRNLEIRTVSHACPSHPYRDNYLNT